MVTQSKEKFDFIILDLSMPIMDGYTACKQIFEHFNDEHKINGQSSICSKSKKLELINKNNNDLD